MVNLKMEALHVLNKEEQKITVQVQNILQEYSDLELKIELRIRSIIKNQSPVRRIRIEVSFTGMENFGSDFIINYYTVGLIEVSQTTTANVPLVIARTAMVLKMWSDITFLKARLDEIDLFHFIAIERKFNILD